MEINKTIKILIAIGIAVFIFTSLFEYTDCGDLDFPGCGWNFK